MGERFEVRARDGSGSFGGYLAKPAGGKGPGIIVIQEIFGVNAGIRQMCDDWAAQGYVAYAPDLFWRIEPGVELTDKSEAEWAKAFDLFGKFNADFGVEDIEASIRAVRGLPECTGKVGVVGFCLGGLLAYLSATRTHSDASVGYYGVGIQDKLHESHAIAKPLMLHIATQDKFVPPDAQAKIRETLGGNRHVTLHDYDADHAFARVDGESRIEACAQLANRRTADFFRQHLG
jgi:carboxymethylenebutenolidase